MSSLVYFNICNQLSLAEAAQNPIPNACIAISKNRIVSSSYTRKIENAAYCKILDNINVKWETAKNEATNKKLGLDKKPPLSRPSSGIKQPVAKTEEKKEEWMKAKSKTEAVELFMGTSEFRKMYLDYCNDNLILCEDDICNSDVSLNECVLFITYLPIKISSCDALLRKGIREIHYCMKMAHEKTVIDYLSKHISVVYEKVG